MQTLRLQILAEWPLNGPLQRLRDAYPRMPAEHLPRIETAYRHFIALALLYPRQRIVPHKAVDELWHQHILHTRDYARFCERVLGTFFHHTPSEGAAAAAQDRGDYITTRRLICHHFGDTKDPDSWLTESLYAMKPPA